MPNVRQFRHRQPQSDPDPGLPPTAARPETFTISFRAPISLDRGVRRRSRDLGMTRGSYLRSIVQGDLNAKDCRHCGHEPLLASIASLYREAKRALADGRISIPERETMTDLIAEQLHLVRSRRAA